jgi:hypothetical protein
LLPILFTYFSLSPLYAYPLLNKNPGWWAGTVYLVNFFTLLQIQPGYFA